MSAITDYKATDSSGNIVSSNAYGNNVAFACLVCGGPVLATLREHMRGSSVAKPTQCGVCEANFWVEVVDSSARLIVHSVQGPHSGRYVQGRQPTHSAEQNVASWGVVSAMLAAYGGADYEELVAAVRQHKHHDGGRAFIDYCIRNGWLQRA